MTPREIELVLEERNALKARCQMLIRMVESRDKEIAALKKEVRALQVELNRG